MNTLLRRLGHTRRSGAAGVSRILLGVLFLSTGVMKFAEVVIGSMLIVGLCARLASLAAILMMVAATYVHLVVHNPDLFPLQPEAPIIPLVALVLSAYVLWAGSGSWSIDQRWHDSTAT